VRRLRILLFVFISLNYSGVVAQLHQFTTPDQRLIYLNKGYSYMVPHMARSFENAMNFHKSFWDYKPYEEVTLLLNDFSDIGNGGTNVIPKNFLSIGISPFNHTYNIIPTNERCQWLMNHELAHVVMCDKYSRSDKRFRKIFGGKVQPDNTNPVSMVNSYLTAPRWYSPRWYHEGIAVFMETWMSGGMGRVLGGYDEMVFRTLVRDSNYFYRLVGLETEGTTIDFQVGVNAYLYGTRFVSYLAYKYGLDKLRQFYSRTDSSKSFYASQFKLVYDKKVKDAWEEWIAWEKDFQQKNLSRIREYPVTARSYITDKPLGSVSRAFIDRKNNKIIAAVNYPGKMAHVAEIDPNTGEMRTVCQVPSPMLYNVGSYAFDESTSSLFMSINNGNWRGLRMIDVKTGKHKDVIKLTRAGNFAFNKQDKSLWAIQHFSGRVNIIRIPQPYNNYEDIFTLRFGRSLFDIDISNDGKYLSAILSDVAGNQRLVIYEIKDLLLGSTKHQVVYEFEESAMSSFRFSDDDKYLIGTSYYTGVSNVWRINVETKKADLLSNAETGFFNPVQISEDSLLVFEFHFNGLRPCKIKIDPIEDANAIVLLGQLVYEKNPEVESWMLPPPSDVDIDSVKISEGKYSPFRSLSFTSAYPVIEGYKNLLGWGYRFNFRDAIGLHTLKLTASWSPYDFLPDKQKIHLDLDYKYWNWYLKASYNKADFYDLFGPTKVSRAGYGVTLKYHKMIRFYRPRKVEFYVQLGAFGDMEKLPAFQNIDAPYTELFTGVANFHYSYLRKSLGAVEYEQGVDWTVFLHTYLANDDLYPRIISNQDFGFLLPVRNTSFWLRTSLGQSFASRKDALSLIYFGGFRNNYIDYQDAQRYREFISFPGMEIDEIAAKNFGKITGELNLKPIRFREFGLLPFYSTYARLSLFGMGLFADATDKNFRQNIYNAGAQLDFELVLFSLLKSTLSFGYARSFHDHFSPGEEFMVSLKLL
jgi:hypothetical protein